MEDRARSRQGDALLVEDAHHVVGHEGLEQQVAARGHEARDEPGDAADVGEREGQGVAVVGGHGEAPDHALRDGVHRLVGVLRPLGLRRGARRVEEPADLVATSRRRRQRDLAGIGLGERAVTGEDRHPADLGRDRRGHRLEVEAAEGGGHHQQRGPGLADAEPDLALAEDVEDRVLGGTEAGERAHEHERLDPGRELPGDDRPRTDAVVPVQRGGDALGAVPVPPEGDAPTALVDRGQHVGRRRRPRLDQLPQRVALEHGTPPFLAPAPTAADLTGRQLRRDGCTSTPDAPARRRGGPPACPAAATPARGRGARRR